MGAGPADDAGEDASLPDEVQRFLEFIVTDQFDVAWNIQRGRTGLHAGGRHGAAVFPGGLFLPFPGLEEGGFEVLDGVQNRGQGRRAAEIAFAVGHDALDDLLDLGKVLCRAFSRGHAQQYLPNPVDADHAYGTLPAGKLSGLGDVGQSKGKHIRLGVKDHQAVPPHEGVVAVPLQGRGERPCRRLLRLSLSFGGGPVIDDLPVPTAKSHFIHASVTFILISEL